MRRLTSAPSPRPHSSRRASCEGRDVSTISPHGSFGARVMLCAPQKRSKCQTGLTPSLPGLGSHREPSTSCQGILLFLFPICDRRAQAETELLRNQGRRFLCVTASSLLHQVITGAVTSEGRGQPRGELSAGLTAIILFINGNSCFSRLVLHLLLSSARTARLTVYALRCRACCTFPGFPRGNEMR